MKLIHIVVVAFFVPISAQAEITIECGGYSPAINDHVEWTMKINGRDAFNGDEHFKVSETKKFFILTGTHSRVHINKVTDRYVTYERAKRTLIEWSRKTPGEGCDISK